ncbi:MAG: hypothetical protein U0271_34315 [Polyangiaceae bacterium]
MAPSVGRTPTHPPSNTNVPPPVSVATSSTGSRTPETVPLEVPDAKHVDVDSILPQMMALARKVDEQAELRLVTVLSPLDAEGFIDLDHGDTPAVVLNFTVNYYDHTKPPGADLVSGYGSISTHTTYCSPSSSPCLRTLYTPGINTPGAAHPLPQCTLQRAWAAAIASGVPRNTVTSQATYGFWGPPTFWSFTVAGHRELERNIDATTCKVATDADVMRAMSATH